MIKPKKEDMNKEKIKYYYNNKISVHLSLESGQWFNGKILSIKDKYFTFEDKKLGKQLIFYSELKDKGISEYQTKKILEKWKK